jgi:hypothetical protein
MSAISNAVESLFKEEKFVGFSQFDNCLIIAGLYLLKDKQEESWKPMVQNLIDKISKTTPIDSE